MTRTFTFNCFLDREDNHPVWCGVCHDLAICTEGETYEALVKRIWLIAPEMAVVHGFVEREGDIKLNFVTEMTAPEAYITAAE